MVILCANVQGSKLHRLNTVLGISGRQRTLYITITKNAAQDTAMGLALCIDSVSDAGDATTLFNPSKESLDHAEYVESRSIATDRLQHRD